MSKLLKIIIVFLGITTIIYFSFSHNNPNDLISSPSDKLKIYTSFFPLYFLTKEIIGQQGLVFNVAGNIDVHEYNLSPKDLTKIFKADLFVFQVLSFEPWTDIVDQLNKKNIKTLDVFFELMQEQKKKLNSENNLYIFNEMDQHTWLDPFLVQSMINIITEKVISIKPSQKEYFVNRSSLLKNKFSIIDLEYKNRLQNCRLKEVIISHRAFDYLGKRYGFILHSISGLSTHDHPSIQRLTRLKSLSINKKMKYIISEEGSIKRFVTTLAREAKLQILPVNTLEKQPKEKNFFTIMQSNLNSFSKALECKS